MGQFLQKYSDQGKLVLSADGQAQPLMDGRDQVFAAWMLRDQGSGDSPTGSARGVFSDSGRGEEAMVQGV